MMALPLPVAARSRALPRSGLGLLIGLGTAALVALIALGAAFELKTGAIRDIALAGSIAAAPLAILLSWRRPLIFPFALYCIVVPLGFLVYLGGVGTVTKLIGGLAVLSLALYILRTKHAVKPHTAMFAWIALILWACTSMIWAIDPQLSWSLVPTLLELVVLYALVTLTPATASDLRIVLASIAAGGVIAAAYGTYLFMQGEQTLGNRLYLQSVSDQETTLDPLHFAAALILPLALIITAALGARKVTTKALLVCLIIVIMAGIYASAARGTFVAVAALVFYLIWKSRHRVQVLLIGLIAAIASLALPTAMWARIANDIGTGSGRTTIWSVGLDALKHYGLVGAGVANFPNAYNESFLKFYDPTFVKWDRAPHNLFLMIGVELGIVGLGLMVWVLISQFKTLSHISPDHELYDLRIALEAAYVGLFFNALFLDIIYWKYTWLAYMTMMITRTVSLRPAAADVRHAVDGAPAWRDGRPRLTVARPSA